MATDKNDPANGSSPEEKPDQKAPSSEIQPKEGVQHDSPVPSAPDMEQDKLKAPMPSHAVPAEASTESDQELAGKTWLGRLLGYRTDPGDATRGEVMLYAFGNIEGAIANQFFNVLKAVMVVAMHVNPLLIGMILGIKTLWDAVTDPIMAHITDNTKSRWGRRRPYILVGGVSRIAILVLIVFFMPTGGHLTKNPVMEAQKFANEGIKEAGEARRTAVQSYEQLPQAGPKVRDKIIKMLPKTLEKVYAPDPETLDAREKITDNLETLRTDLAEREAQVEERQQIVDDLKAQFAGRPLELHEALQAPVGLLESAQEKTRKAQELLKKALEARRDAIAARYVLEYLIAKADGQQVTKEGAQAAANAEFAEMGLDPVEDIFTVEQKSVPKPAAAKAGFFGGLANAIGLMNNPEDPVRLARKTLNKADKEVRDLHDNVLEIYEAYPLTSGGKQEKMTQTLEQVQAQTGEITTEVETRLDGLEAAVAEREAEVAAKEAAFEELKTQNAEADNLEELLRKPEKDLVASRKRLRKLQGMLQQAEDIQAKAIASRAIAGHILSTADNLEVYFHEDAVKESVEQLSSAAGVNPMKDIFVPAQKTGMFSEISNGLVAYIDPRNAEQQTLILYVLIALLVFTTLTTVQSVPYYALGIELSPSYDGRTQVVTYRSIMDKFAGLIAPWVPVFCFSLWFTSALDGLFWVALFACIIGIPSTVLMCMYTRERTHASARKKKNKLLTDRASKASGFRKGLGYALDLFSTMWEVGKNRHFLKIFALYWFIGLTNGIFAQIGFYLNIYWVMGSALSGAKLGAWLSMLAWALGFLMLPLINWGCRKFQKHRVLSFAVIWMAIGTALKWWAMDPEHPEYQFVLPFFFSVGIGSVYTVLPTMMADVTDVDELNYGARREGMFGAVMAFLMKMIGTFTPILAGAVLVMSGFDPALEYEQAPETILNMRLMYSLVPAGMLLTALAILWRYPLNRARVQEVKAELKRRHAAEDAADEQEGGQTAGA